MPEGPSLVLAREELLLLVGQKVTEASGAARLPWDALPGQQLRDIKTWGKHLLLLFDDMTVRIHFLMFGTWYINSSKDKVPKMTLHFSGGDYVNFYTCAVKVLEEPPEVLYDWRRDVMSEAFDAAATRKLLRAQPNRLVVDVLMDQTIFSGVGNIIKNEVCYRIQVHPASRVGALPAKQLNQLVKEAVRYSHDFLSWKREGTLRAHWLAHTKKTCSRDGNALVKEYMGETARRTFYCPVCQVLYR